MKDQVHTIEAYHDGPIAGIADFEGKPHYYECQFDPDADEYSDTFLLTPMTDSTFQLALERWNIWLRWEAAFKAGHTKLETHPALPEEWPRREELDHNVRRDIDIARTDSFRAQGRFFYNGPGVAGSRTKISGVEWIRLER